MVNIKDVYKYIINLYYSEKYVIDNENNYKI